MANEARKIRQMLHAVRSQLRSELSEMADDVLRQRFGASREASQGKADASDFNVEHLRTELALRTMASRYALLSRIDEALEPPGEAACDSPERAVTQNAASHDAVAV